MRKFLAASLLLLLAACGGGGGGGGGGSTGGGSPTPAPQPTIAEATRLLNQGTFGAKVSSIDAVRAAGLNTWISQQIAAPVSSAHQTYLENRLVGLRATDPNASLNANHFYETWWRSAATGDDELRQRVAFALSQIFVISLNDSSIDVRGAGSYYDMLTRNAFGNFRTLLEDVTLHPI